MSYVNLSTFKRYVGADATTDDDLLQDCLSDAQKYIETQTSRIFECTADTTRYFDAFADTVQYRELFFDTDLCQITSVVNGDGATITTAQYVTNPRNITPYYSIQLKLSSTTYLNYDTSPENAIAVTGRWAYSLTPPQDIIHATKRLAKWYYNQRDTSAEVDRPMLTNSGATLLPSAIPKDISDILNTYKRRQP